LNRTGKGRGRAPRNVLPQEHLAARLGVAESTLKLCIARGCPMPTTRRELDGWPARWHVWRASTRRRPGPAPASLLDQEEHKLIVATRRARFLSATIDLRVKQGRYVERKLVEEQSVRQIVAVRQALHSIARAMGRRLFGAPTEQAIEEALLAEFRLVCDAFASGLEALDRDTTAAATNGVAAEPGDADDPVADLE
jgi:hypothetical protein